MAEPEISVVVPVFNEGAVIEKMLEELKGVLAAINRDYEIIVVNDGSTDDTGNIAREIADGDERIHLITFSRNFGKEAALEAGLEFNSGKCVIFIDADFQHPPQLVADMIRLWEDGYDVVNAVKTRRKPDAYLHRIFADTFNRIMSYAVGSDFAGASDFKLIDRQVADAIIACRERNRFFRGLVAWVGFNTKNISFEVEDRQAGSSKWSTFNLARYFLNNVIAFSSFPLVIVSIIGFITAALGVLLFLQTLYNFFFGDAATGFTTVISLQILLGGMILAALGVVGLYIAKIYNEQKSRPLFIVSKPRSEAQTDEVNDQDGP